MHTAWMIAVFVVLFVVGYGLVAGLWCIAIYCLWVLVAVESFGAPPLSLGQCFVIGCFLVAMQVSFRGRSKVREEK